MTKVFQFKHHKVILTDDFLVFDQDKTVGLETLTIVQMPKDEKIAYCIIGQFFPGAFFTYLNVGEDDLVKAILQIGKGNLITKKAVGFSGKLNGNGTISLQDDWKLEWYHVSQGPFMFFRKGKDKFGYGYLRRVFTKCTFSFLEEVESLEKEHSINALVVPWNPFDDDSLEEYKESLQAYKDAGGDKSIRWNERFGPSVGSQLKVSALVLLFFFVLFIVLLFFMA